MQIDGRGSEGVSARWMCCVVAFTTMTSLGCQGGPPGSEQVETNQAALLGTVTYGSDCTASQQAFLENAMRWGRIAASSTLMRTCLTDLGTAIPDFHSPYMPCNNVDPGWDESAAEQSRRVLTRVVNPNPLTINCTGGLGNASTFMGTWDTTAESFSWGAWFVDKESQVGANPQNPAWPYSQAIAIIWHEVMHNYGYGHGDNFDNDAAKAACGYAAASSYHFQWNSMPYLVEHCMQSVINSSGVNNVCGDTTTCGPNALPIRAGVDPSSRCECVADPRVPATAVSLQATVTRYSDWGTGFSGAVTIANIGADPTSSWTVVLNVGPSVTDVSVNNCRVVLSASGADVLATITPNEGDEWAQVIDAGQTRTFSVNVVRSANQSQTPTVVSATGISSCYDAWPDTDWDGFGDKQGAAKRECHRTPPAGWVRNNTDCCDKDNQVYPGPRRNGEPEWKGYPSWNCKKSDGSSFWDYNCSGTLEKKSNGRHCQGHTDCAMDTTTNQCTVHVKPGDALPEECIFEKDANGNPVRFDYYSDYGTGECGQAWYVSVAGCATASGPPVPQCTGWANGYQGGIQECQ